MRVVVVIDETRFYHPAFLAAVLARTADEFVGVARVTGVPRKHNIEHYLMRNWYRLRPWEMGVLAWRKYSAAARELLGGGRGPTFLSVAGVLRHHAIPCRDVRDSLNRPDCLQWFRDLAPDVILSSNSLIFGKELLSLPTRCCINRHSALLPSYGGLWPVFQAYRAGERCVGASVHTMERRIDQGVVLAHRQTEIRPGDSLSDLYERCFALSADAVLDALDKIRADDFSPDGGGGEPSYFSFPEPAHWRQFRARGGRFV